MGRILYQKIDDMKKQEQVVNHRKYDIALVTDSIADLTQEFIDEYQIQIIHLNIMKKDRVYFDKLTIHRITSYNVCYTKLLRTGPCFQ